MGLDHSLAPVHGAAIGELYPALTRPRDRELASATGRHPGLRAAARRWAPLFPALVTLAVTLWQIQVPSFWRDEAATLSATQRPFPGMFRMLGNQDAVHGAYYVLMWAVVRLGGSGELAARLPSALGMAAAAAAVTVLGRRMVSPRAGAAAGLVFAALPPVSWFGQDARPFAIETALACVASYLFIRVQDARGRERRRWLGGYAVALALLGLANLFGLLLIAAHAATLALRYRQGRWLVRGWLAAVTAVGAVMLPFGWLDWTERRQIQWLEVAGLPAPVTLERLLGSMALAPVMLLIVTFAIVISALGGRARLRADWPWRLPALCLPWLLLPLGILLAVSQLQPVYTFRYIVFCIPAAALLIGAGLAAVGRPAACAALALIVVLGLPAQASERGPLGHGDGIRQLDQILASRELPGDAVIYPGDGGLRVFAAAYPYGLATLPDAALGQTPVRSATIGGTNAPAAQIRRRLAGVRRVWVPEVVKARPAGPVPALRGLPFRLAGTWALGGNVWLALYARQGTPGVIPPATPPRLRTGPRGRILSQE